MSKVGRWSTTPGNNNSSAPDGWPEGQPPSTVNDCAREMMAQIRTLIADAQYIDQDFTPTYISATTFSVPGDQTSAIHSGRRLKIFDGTAGVATTIYATVLTASYTALTTITVENDAGQLTTSLSSFALAIMTNRNDSLPRDLVLSVSSIACGSMSISGTAVFSGIVSFKNTADFSASAQFNQRVGFAATAVANNLYVLSGCNLATLSVGGVCDIGGRLTALTTFTASGAAVLKGALSVGGAVILASTLDISGTAVAANIAKAWVRCAPVAGTATVAITSSFNVGSVSRSATGVFRVNFSNAFADSNYCPMFTLMNPDGSSELTFPHYGTFAAGSLKFVTRTAAGSATDVPVVCLSIYR